LNYIELNCSFKQSPTDFSQSTNSEYSDFSDYLQLNTGDTFGWDELLKLHRVILISEAGSEKTKEIRQTSIKLRAEGKQTFFIILEYLSDGIEDVFEEGNFQAFQSWLNSTDEGWILLNSIDEARLKSLRDFELAIKK